MGVRGRAISDLPIYDKLAPLQYQKELAYCPVRPWYRHKWASSKRLPIKKDTYTEILRCRRCTAYMVVRIRLSEGEPTRDIQFVKTTNFETLSEWDSNVRYKL